MEIGATFFRSSQGVLNNQLSEGVLLPENLCVHLQLNV
jgi:hypothetical protein